MKKIAKLLLAAMTLAGITAACSDLSRLQDDLSSLENRVEVLEKVIPTLNKNIEALQALVEATSINSVELSDGTYTVTLTNGEKIVLTQGSIGVGNVPVMSVDKDGYWMVDYQDGNGPVYIESEGGKVAASGQDGVTPEFGVDENNYWTVSYDGGKTFVQVKDVNGKPVPALGEGASADPFFKDVKFENGKFTVVLNTGETLEIPVVPSFLCSIVNDGSEQLFAYSETKVYEMEVKGVASTVVAAPEGWSAVLSGNSLTVTAPVMTKSLIADSRTDVSVLAVSAQGFAAIAKIRVRLTDKPVEHNPSATVVAGKVTDSSIAFEVTLSDVTSWKYILKKSSEAAPSVEELETSGTEGSETALVLSSLEHSTAYTLYVLPVNGDKKGNIAEAEAVTAAPAVGNDLYKAYMDGLEIVVAGKTYSKAVNGEPVLLVSETADFNISDKILKQSAVVFLEEKNGNSFLVKDDANKDKSTLIDGNVAVIGRYADKRPTLACDGALRLVKGSLALGNLVIRNNAAGSYILGNAAAPSEDKGVFDGVYVGNCYFKDTKASLMYLSASKWGIAEIVAKDNVIEIADGAKANTQLFNLSGTEVIDTYKVITIENNLIYSKSGVKGVQFVSCNLNTVQTGTAFETKVSICNNTIYNLVGYNVYFKYYQVASLNFNRNLMYADTYTKDSYNVILGSNNQTGTGVDLSDNVVYGLGEGRRWQQTHSNSAYREEENIIQKAEENPFSTAEPSTMTFVVKPAYSKYGKQN